MPNFNTFAKNEVTQWPTPNYWDIVAILFVVGLIVLLGWGGMHMHDHFHMGHAIPITLNPWRLPYYALRTFLRMLIAMCCSLIFTFLFATLAAKNKHAERIIIPFIDIMQSVPVLGFLSIIVVAFIALFHGSLLGPECAAIFAIFTAQVWNMALSFYQSLRTVPDTMIEAAKMFQLSTWQTFWKVEVPFAMPGLLWNMMMSMSGSWVFLVASEAITVGKYTITLPGIGSYISLAIHQRALHAIGFAIIAMALVIFLYDQILFRPLTAWATKFNTQDISLEDTPTSWVLTLFQRTRFCQFLGKFLAIFSDFFVNTLFSQHTDAPVKKQTNPFIRKISLWLFYAVVVVCLFTTGYFVAEFIFSHIPLSDSIHVIYLGLLTALRVTVVIIICSLIWVPIGVCIGLNTRLSQRIQPIVQFLAAFPANLLFPLVVYMILHYQLNVNIWTSPLMVLGTQWYILFNVIAGTMNLPKNLHYAVGTLKVRGWLWWKRFVLPGIFPFYITGAITAAGGAWNYSIIAEAITWGHTTLYASGLGAYITKNYTAGNFPKLALGIVVMSLFVLLLNRVMWKPLYQLAEKRFQIK